MTAESPPTNSPDHDSDKVDREDRAGDPVSIRVVSAVEPEVSRAHPARAAVVAQADEATRADARLRVDEADPVDGLQLPDDPDLPVRADAVGPVVGLAVGLAVGPVVDRVSRDVLVHRDAPAHRDADQTPMP